MSSNEDSGWGGSYLELIINGEDSYILTSGDAFEQFDFDIAAGDDIEIIFYEDASIDGCLVGIRLQLWILERDANQRFVGGDHFLVCFRV